MTHRIHAAKAFALLCCLGLLSAGCGTSSPLREAFRKTTPYEKYRQALQNTRLDQTALGQDWLAAGQRALRDSLVVTIPFRETGYFAADEPTAYSYRVNARRGERLTVRVDVQSAKAVKVFVDVFELEGAPKAVASADTVETAIVYDVENDLQHLIRVQPELLRSGRYTLSITSGPTLGFPVSGKNSSNIGSFWGADRDGGVRRHEGIDVFAPRGTPAIASANGVVRDAGVNNLGGKVVWLADENRNQTLYYAHLDSQLVQPGQRMRIGDTLGLVGSTGNAAFAGPHLHFGIYRWNTGAIDPYPFVKKPSGEPAAVKVPLENLGKWHRVSAKKALLKASPDGKPLDLPEAGRHTPLRVLGGTGNWYRVALPDGTTGYLPAKQLEIARTPIQKLNLKQETPVTDQPQPSAAVMQTLGKGEIVAALARFGVYWLVETPENGKGWLRTD